MLVTIVSLVIALSILVFVHEFGHYLAARRAGVVVEEFGFGYPPRVLTLFHLPGKIVLDGVEIVIPRGTYLHGDFHYGQQVVYQTRTGDDGRPELAAIEPAEESTLEGRTASIEFLDPGTIFTLNAIPFGGFARMLGEEDPSAPGSLAGKGKLARIFVLAAGAVMNLLVAVLFFAAAMALGAPTVDENGGVVITDVTPGSPAQAAGLQPDDVIVGADGSAIQNIDELQAFTRAHLGEQVVLSVERGAQNLQVPVVPRPEPPPDEGPIGIGISPRTTIVKYPWYEALWRATQQTVRMTLFIFTVPVQVIQGLIPAELARPVGPVGVGQMVGDAVQYSLKSGWWYPVMQMMGSLGVALAVTNLLPLPALDGGRILFVIVEGIRGRRIDPAKEGLIHLIGMALLVALMLFITWQDVINPVPSIDWSNLF